MYWQLLVWYNTCASCVSEDVFHQLWQLVSYVLIVDIITVLVSCYVTSW